jgi:Domain of unknown function (DUF4136)
MDHALCRMKAMRAGGSASNAAVWRTNPREKIMKWLSVVLLGAVTSCSAATVPTKGVATSIAAPHASFTSYRTFSFGLSDQPKSGYEVTARSLEVQRRLRPLVQQVLQERGYLEDAAKGDLVVKLATGTGAVPNRTAEHAIATGLAQGFIGIDIYDGSTGGEVWQGSAFAEIDPDKVDDSLLKMGVSHMLADFPARSAAGVASAR